MGKITDQAIRIGYEKSWKEFEKYHPEIYIFFDGDTPIDVDFISSKIENSSAHIVNGVLESIQYVFEGEFIIYPR